MIKIDIYLRPQENPRMIVDDTDLRLYYNKQWVDFRGGEIIINEGLVVVNAQHSCRNCGELQGDQELCPNCGTDPHH